MATKRVRYSDTSSSGTESDNDHDEYNKFNTMKRKQREPKSFSKNALMARENRLKKKLYMENLERELTKERQKNKKYMNVLKRQADVIQKHEREIKYMRGVLANNSDISKLVKTLHYNTGMAVGTSLNKNFTIRGNNEQQPEKITQPSAADVIITDLHPWSDAQLTNGALDIQFDDLLDVPPISPSLDDHNYTLASSETDESLGVCLHISNHKVSLEYCAQCHENASRVWSEEDCIWMHLEGQDAHALSAPGANLTLKWCYAEFSQMPNRDRTGGVDGDAVISTDFDEVQYCEAMTRVKDRWSIQNVSFHTTWQFISCIITS